MGAVDHDDKLTMNIRPSNRIRYWCW